MINIMYVIHYFILIISLIMKNASCYSFFIAETHSLYFDGCIPFRFLHRDSFQTQVQACIRNLFSNFNSFIYFFEFSRIDMLSLLFWSSRIIDYDLCQITHDFFDQFCSYMLNTNRFTVEQSIAGDEFTSISHTLYVSSTMKSYPNNSWVFFLF